MSEIPPPELVVNKVGTALALELGHTMLNPRDGIPGPNTARIARKVLAALAEWADGGLIDPLTWTVVEVKKVARVVVDAWSMDGWPMEMHAELTDPADRCDGDPLWLLSPREGER